MHTDDRAHPQLGSSLQLQFGHTLRNGFPVWMLRCFKRRLIGARTASGLVARVQRHSLNVRSVVAVRTFRA
jgi:hypothetical protein